MPRKKETAGQYSMDDYRLKQVDIRLKLRKGHLLQPDTAYKPGRRSGSYAGCAEGA